jgi:hypothetical protein
VALEKALKNLLRGKSMNAQGGANNLKLTPGAGGQIVPAQDFNQQGNGLSNRSGSGANASDDADFEN